MDRKENCSEQAYEIALNSYSSSDIDKWNILILCIKGSNPVHSRTHIDKEKIH